MSKPIRETRKTELVETHNIALALERMNGAPYDSDRWKRALYHALAMSRVSDREMLRKIREALELP